MCLMGAPEMPSVSCFAFKNVQFQGEFSCFYFTEIINKFETNASIQVLDFIFTNLPATCDKF